MVAGAWFRWTNERDEPARMLCMFAPVGFEQFCLDVMAGAGAANGDLRSVIGPIRARYGDEDHLGADSAVPSITGRRRGPRSPTAGLVPFPRGD